MNSSSQMNDPTNPKPTAKMKRDAQGPWDDDSDAPPLSKGDIAELRRRTKDLDDPVRYVIISPFSRRFSLYYIPADGLFVMNEILPSCLFKRKAEADAVAAVLESRRKGRRARGLQVMAVRKTKTGVRIIDPIRDPFKPNSRWKPELRRGKRAA
jgi:hypothetical protein